MDDAPENLESFLHDLRTLPQVEIVVEDQGPRAAERLEKEMPDVLIADLQMPELSGLELLRLGRQRDPNLIAVIITANPTVKAAVECMKLGAAEFITKPFPSGELLRIVQKLLDSKKGPDAQAVVREEHLRDSSFGEILGGSPAMKKVFDGIQRAAEAPFDVLVTGETGTGKELVAQAIHQRSRRQQGPFVAVDCGAIPHDLLESEFFGHERGAFTGAQVRKVGLLESANHGTFFLDELAQLPLHLQAKLLRVLQERRVRRVGGTSETSLDVRFIAASSADLEQQVREGRFRLDLFHRIRVLGIRLPPLRERIEDIPLLVDHFLDRCSRDLQRENVQFSPEAMQILTHYCWPGNVRELQNVLRETLVMASGPVITPNDLPQYVVTDSASCCSKGDTNFFTERASRIAAFETQYIHTLLSAFAGDVSAAAREMQVPRCTFYRLLKKHDVNPAHFRRAASTA
ncbi:MAG TPA: sigma-54 dependent transcriptional regulator [Verrucomicrobiae bacterium]